MKNDDKGFLKLKKKKKKKNLRFVSSDIHRAESYSIESSIRHLFKYQFFPYTKVKTFVEDKIALV